MTDLRDLRDTEGRRWKVRRSLSHDSERALLLRRTSGSHFRTGVCRIRFAAGRVEIVSQGLGGIEEEERGDGSIRRTRVAPRGEIVGVIADAESVERLRRMREEMLRAEASS